MMQLIERLFGPRPADRVDFDARGVTRRLSDGRTEAIAWSELAEVFVVTTDEGPLREDVFWILAGPGRRSGVAVPGGAEGMDRLLTRLQALPGFDNEAVIRAMASCEDAEFVCWRALPPAANSPSRAERGRRISYSAAAALPRNSPSERSEGGESAPKTAASAVPKNS